MLFSTLDTITTKYGFVMEEPQLATYPVGQKYVDAPEVKEIADQLIKKFRPELAGWNIGYAFKAKAPKKEDMEVLGMAKKENDLSSLYSKIDAYIVMPFDKWVTMDADQKFRVTFHELEHLFPNIEKGTLDLLDHPINEFPSVIRIFGPGQESDVMFIEAYNQFCKDNSTAIDDINAQRAKRDEVGNDDI